MFMNTNGLIGYGYWGKILAKTLESPLNIYDPYTEYSDPMVLTKCKNVFVATPVRTHEQYCVASLANRQNVFCEKVLTGNVDSSTRLFDMASECGAYLFVDWIYLYNNHVHYIKDFIQNHSLGKLLSISMNRLNFGPVRTDVSAKVDLAAHDISILYYMLKPKNIGCQWLEYKRCKESTQNDSCIGLLTIDDVFVQINCSWSYRQKDRMCIFEFEHGFLKWDDMTKTIVVNDKSVHVEHKAPLANSIQAFLQKTTNQNDIRNTTLFVEEVLCM